MISSFRGSETFKCRGGREGGRGLETAASIFSRDVKFIKFIFCLPKKSLKYSTHTGRNNFEQFKGQNGNIGSILMSLIPHTTVIFSY